MNAVVIAGGIALGTAVVTSAIQSWLSTRAKTIEGLREERLVVYPEAWEHTRVLSRWPRTNVTGRDVDELHRTFRRWYFTVGGLYMSEHARERYGDMQELLGLYLARSPDARGPIESDVYTALQDACSAFRSALTEDLESRRVASLWWVAQRWSRHRKEARKAEKRKSVWLRPGETSSSHCAEVEIGHVDLAKDLSVSPSSRSHGPGPDQKEP